MENEIIDNAQELSGSYGDLPQDALQGQDQNPQDSQQENNEYEDVSRETTNSYKEVNTETLLQELREIKAQQTADREQFLQATHYLQQMAQANQQQDDIPLTADDVVKQGIEKYIHDQHQAKLAQEYQQVSQKFNQSVRQAESRFKDFHQVMNSRGQLPEAMFEAILASDDSGAFAYHAAKSHSAELDRISNITNPLLQRREMTMLEAKIKASGQPRTVSRAPTPLREESSSAGTSSTDDLNTADGLMSYLNRIKR